MTVQNPIREQIRLDERRHAHSINGQNVSVFVPGSWAGARVVLKPGTRAAWTGAEAGGKDLPHDAHEHVWSAGEALEPGQWNTVKAHGGQTAEGRLEATPHLHLAGLEAKAASQRSLAVRVRLDGPEPAPTDAETVNGARLGALLTVVLSLTAADGRLVGGTEVTLGRRARELTVELPAPRHGLYRLKAVLCEGEQIIDNARIDFQA